MLPGIFPPRCFSRACLPEGTKAVLVRNLLILMIAVAVFWLAANRILQDDHPAAQPPASEHAVAEPFTPLQRRVQNRVGDITVHTVEELELLFTRVEQLLDRPRGDGEQPLVSLVLHGPEVQFFAFKNYDQYRTVVDRAAKLAALGAVDISICQTQMRNYGIGPDQVPAFLRQVPFGPDEVERLLDQGFVYM
jgi:intracellular sulfur oxidation DsrE/DsrF family protein